MCHTQWTAWLNFSLGSGPTECQSHREPRALPLASPSYVQRENQKSRKALRLRGPQHLSPALDPRGNLQPSRAQPLQEATCSAEC